MSLKPLGLFPEVRGEDSIPPSGQHRKETISRLDCQYISSKKCVSWRMEALVWKLAFCDYEGHSHPTFILRTSLSTTSRGSDQSESRVSITSGTQSLSSSPVVTAAPSSRALPFTGGVFVRVDVGDAVDLSDLTSHQVEQSSAKHDLKCAGPRANAAVTSAAPRCHLPQRPTRGDSRGVPKTNHCCVW